MIHPDDVALRDAIQEGRERMAEKRPLDAQALSCGYCGRPMQLAASICGNCCDQAMEVQDHGWGDPLTILDEQLPLPGAAFTPPEWMEDE